MQQELTFEWYRPGPEIWDRENRRYVAGPLGHYHDDPNYGYNIKESLLPLPKFLAKGCYAHVYGLSDKMVLKVAKFDSTFCWLALSMWARRQGIALDFMPNVHGLELRDNLYIAQLERLDGTLTEFMERNAEHSGLMRAECVDQAIEWITANDPTPNHMRPYIIDDTHGGNWMYAERPDGRHWYLTDPGAHEPPRKTLEAYLELAYS